MKTMEDGSCSFDTSLSWAQSAKNSFHNVKCFSLNQLVFGFNPNVPSVFINELPVLEKISISGSGQEFKCFTCFKKSLHYCRGVREVSRALRHNVQRNLSHEFNNADSVYFKRNDSERWMGAGVMIRLENNKQVLVKHGGSYVRVHPCRLQYCGRNGIVTSQASSECNDKVEEAVVEEPVKKPDETKRFEKTDAVHPTAPPWVS